MLVKLTEAFTNICNHWVELRVVLFCYILHIPAVAFIEVFKGAKNWLHPYL